MWFRENCFIISIDVCYEQLVINDWHRPMINVLLAVKSNYVSVFFFFILLSSPSKLKFTKPFFLIRAEIKIVSARFMRRFLGGDKPHFVSVNFIGVVFYAALITYNFGSELITINDGLNKKKMNDIKNHFVDSKIDGNNFGCFNI